MDLTKLLTTLESENLLFIKAAGTYFLRNTYFVHWSPYMQNMHVHVFSKDTIT